jgi:hypothetical protein
MRLLLTSLFALAGLVSCAAPGRPDPRPAGSTAVSEWNDHEVMAVCGWYCGVPAPKVTATSTLLKGAEHAANDAHDGKKDTAWVEGAEGHGIGERIAFGFGHEGKSAGKPSGVGISEVSIINGFARSEKLWRAHGRAKTLKVYFNGRYRTTLQLEDTRKPQKFALPRMPFVSGRVNKVEFEIVDVYPGEKYQDTALADFFFGGFGVTH